MSVINNMALTLYIDESGHSGTDLHEEAQPIFVHVGVWLSEQNAILAENELARLRRQHRLQPPLERLKGRTLVGTTHGQKFIRDLLKFIRETKIPISIAILDKAFVAAGVIVEDCTDYAYNNAFDISWTSDTTRKEPLALWIYKTVAPSLLEAAWKSRRADAATLKGAYERVFGVLRLSPNVALASLAARMSQVDYSDLANTVAGARDLTGSDYSPNLTTFSALMLHCDLQGDEIGAAQNATPVIHDEQIEFAELFSYWFSIWKNASSSTAAARPWEEVRLPLRNLSSLSFGDSEQHVGIRLADIIAAAVRVTVHSLLYGSGSTGDFFGALRDLLDTRELLGRFPYIVADQDTQRRIWHHLRGR